MSWRELALCQHVSQASFFPEAGENVHEARRICALCPVKEPCLSFALDNAVEYGVWGGLTVKERLNLQAAKPHQCKKGHVIEGDNAKPYTAVRNGLTLTLYRCRSCHRAADQHYDRRRSSCTHGFVSGCQECGREHGKEGAEKRWSA